MSSVGGGPGAGPRGLRARIVAVPLRWLGLSAGAAALAASGLFGGLETVEEPEVPAAKIHELSKGEPWNVTVDGGRLVGDGLPGLRLTNPANRWVVVLATVEVTANESRNDTDDIIDISGVEGLVEKPDYPRLEPQYVIGLRDGTHVNYLQPSMPEKLAFFYEQESTAPVPTEVTVTINQKTYRVDTLTNSKEWKDLEPRAELTVPIEDRRGK
ncbi:hypothetical protein [Phytohabitans houttuyneae]|uniref:Uncharacterized protein n=1 Tax=Phytohabitans houttuyneae TaxID=1076126 RepID=A0A6V8KF58_9ACTN|nr:hypothetical protein [Phytohabitans houttuyneae]GFJ79375.1 hypothetical protein Phou_035550 [Phytohabitans houttuyneae]